MVLIAVLVSELWQQYARVHVQFVWLSSLTLQRLRQLMVSDLSQRRKSSSDLPARSF